VREAPKFSLIDPSEEKTRTPEEPNIDKRSKERINQTSSFCRGMSFASRIIFTSRALAPCSKSKEDSSANLCDRNQGKVQCR
jgi:hypothetical protein